MFLMPGVLGTGALALSTGFGAYLGEKEAEQDNSGRPAVMTKLSVTAGCVAAVFWGWALFNTVFLHFDLGVLSFALALGASAFGGGKFNSIGIPLTTENYRAATLVGYGAVAANYALGIILVDSTGSQIYFGLGMALWITFAGVALSIAREGGECERRRGTGPARLPPSFAAARIIARLFP